MVRQHVSWTESEYYERCRIGGENSVERDGSEHEREVQDVPACRGQKYEIE